uniref:Uncharacterized protein n=1 Tax=Leersia perrieri TaxID=77586 RepID=A0A0D9X1T3_9ORYZ
MAVERVMIKVALSLALLLPLASSSAVEEVKFDFMYFVQQWPASYCATNPCRAKPPPPAGAFTIHGLWPNYLKPTPGKPGPENCNSSDHLNPSQIQDLVNPLTQQWPSLSRAMNNLEFWGHEWQKHGTCSNFNQHGYFNATLALKIKPSNDIAKILAESHIVPSNKNAYGFGEISDAVAKGTGFRANLQCIKDKANGETLLYQVYQCVDRFGKNVVRCEAKMESHCPASGKRIKLPVLPLHSAL